MRSKWIAAKNWWVPYQADEGKVKSLSEEDLGDSSGDITLLKPHFEMQINIWY